MGRPAGAWVGKWLNAWTGVGRWVGGSGGRASGSFAFRYLKKKALPFYDIALESAQAALNRLEGKGFKGGGVSPLVFQGAAVQNELSEDGYGWMDVLVHTRLHQALFRILHAALCKLPAKSALDKQAGMSRQTPTHPSTYRSIHPSIHSSRHSM